MNPADGTMDDVSIGRALTRSRSSGVESFHVLGLVGASATLPLLAVGALVTSEFDAIAAVCAGGVLAVSVLLYFALHGSAWRDSVICWPLVQLLTLLGYRLVAPQAASMAVGVIVLAFVYIGVCLPPGRSVYVLPIAAAVALTLYHQGVEASLWRLVLSMIIWVVVSELPARLIADLDHQRRLLGDEGEALRAARNNLQTIADIDALTGLLTRRAWNERWPLLLSPAHREVAVALLDLDNFKAYNDARGHLAGDLLLRTFARRLQGGLRTIDVVARWGGEEFAVALPGCDAATAQAVLGRLMRRVPDGQTCSVGIATYSSTDDATDAFARADQALYAAKSAGRDRIVVA